MRNVWPVSVIAMGILSLSGCGSMESPGGASSVSALSSAEVSDSAPADGTLSAQDFGIDDVAATCNQAMSMTVNGNVVGDEINGSTDTDAYRWDGDALQHTYRIQAASKDTNLLLDCRLYYGNAQGMWPLITSHINAAGCDFSYVSNLPRTYCVRISGHDGASSPVKVYLRVVG